MTEQPPCGMLIPRHPDDHDQPDRYCGKPSSFVYDATHSICQECYDSMADDPDIQADYVRIYGVIG